MAKRLTAFIACASMFMLLSPVLSIAAAPIVGNRSPASVESPIPSADSPAQVASPPVDDRATQYDVLSRVLSEPQRKMLNRDSRCGDARTATSAFVASDGKALQTGVDAMAALEKCATLSRVGDDWSDFRDYVITAAAALAYSVGASAHDERLLQRAIEDASHVSGYDASSATVSRYAANNDLRMANPGSNTATGHGMGQGPAQSDMRSVKDTRPVSANHGTYGELATEIAGAANTRLERIGETRKQQH